MSCLFELDFLLSSMKNSCLKKGASSFPSVATDSRKDLKNKIFFALKGSHFDGHDFLDAAREKGALGFVISNKQKAQVLLKNKELSVLYVPDTLKALQSLAQHWTKKRETKVIAVTGSNGKTTTKTFAQTLLSNLSPFANPKSYNNAIGIPLSLLNVDRSKAFLIQEIGINHAGEMAFLTSLCDPIISAITMIGPSHLKGLGSLKKIAEEKKQIYMNSPKALWIFNKDNSWTQTLYQELAPSHHSTLTFSSTKKADVQLQLRKKTAQCSLIEGSLNSIHSKIEVSFSGKHNLENLMCACALALGTGIDPKQIWNFIPKCKAPVGRQEWFEIKEKDIAILFDAYNANPSSMLAFFETCEQWTKANQQTVFILGDMKELGKDSIKYHKQLASYPALLNSRFIVFIGEYKDLIEEQLNHNGFKGRFLGSTTYDNHILSHLKEEIKPKDFLAMKASRSLKLENVFFDLTGKKILG